MMPPDAMKSGCPDLPAPITNGHPPAPAPTSCGAGTLAEVGLLREQGAGSKVRTGSVLRALRRCGLPALLLGVLGAASAAGATWSRWPARYTTQALVQLVPRPGISGEEVQQHVRTRLALLRSRRILNGALRRPEVAGLDSIQGLADPAATLEKNMQVDAVLGPELLRITLSGDRPEELPVLVHALVAVLIEEAALAERATYQARLDQLTALESEYKQLLQPARAKLQGLEQRQAPGQRVPEIEEMRHTVVTLEHRLMRVHENLDGLKLDASLAARVNPFDGPTEPKSENKDRQMTMASAAGLGAFGLCFAGVWWREVRTRRVRSAQDVGGLLGTLPALPARARRARPVDFTEPKGRWQERLGEAVDALRARLLRAAEHEGLKIVMVTSAVGGEGTSSLARHLAVSLARAWRRTLLIDGDLRKPSVHDQFGQPLEPGFCDVLRGELDFGDVVRPTPVSRLWVVSAGQCDAHALQGLAQDTVGKLFDALRGQYDFVLIDASPVLPVADTLALGQRVDGVIFAVLRDVSRLPAVQAAQQRLAALAIRMLGAVVLGDKSPVGGYNRATRAKSSQ